MMYNSSCREDEEIDVSIMNCCIMCVNCIWRNGPYIGGHLAFFFKLNFKHVYNLR